MTHADCMAHWFGKLVPRNINLNIKNNKKHVNVANFNDFDFALYFTSILSTKSIFIFVIRVDIINS